MIVNTMGTVAAGEDWSAVGSALAKTGTVSPGEVYRGGLPRTDLHVTLHGVEIKPTLALGGWLAFRSHGGMTMVMGDLVITGDAVNPVIKKLIDSGIEITAVHNHIVDNDSRLFFMHFWANDDAMKLATRLLKALDQVTLARS